LHGNGHLNGSVDLHFLILFVAGSEDLLSEEKKEDIKEIEGDLDAREANDGGENGSGRSIEFLESFEPSLEVAALLCAAAVSSQVHIFRAHSLDLGVGHPGDHVHCQAEADVHEVLYQSNGAVEVFLVLLIH